MVENNAEYGGSESDDPRSEATLCRVWDGNKQPLASTISPEGHRQMTTIGGRRFLTLFFNNGKTQVYDLKKTPISIDYFPHISPEQGNLRAAWCDGELLRSNKCTPHEIAPRDRTNDTPCRDVFLAARKPSALERVLRTTQNYLRLFVNRLRGVLI